MKFNYIFKTVFLAALAFVLASCNREFEEITEMDLSRCLTPTDLGVRVSMENGVDVTFDWNVGKDAENYNLVVYSDEEMTTEILNEEIPASEVPFVTTLSADQQCWFKVRAISSKRDASAWAVFDGSFKTFAVASNLFPEITGRTATSVTMKWSKEFSDSEKVTHITCTPVNGGDAVTYELTEADIAAGEATVEGLTASTEYQVVLFLSSASCGGVDAWTMADPEGLTVITTAEALKAAFADGGNYLLKYSDTPYKMETVVAKAAIKLVGELSADGKRPVISGAISLNSDLNAPEGDLYFEGVEFNGAPSYNRVIDQLAGTTPIVRDIKFVNCRITAYVRGLLSDGNNDAVATINELCFDSCEIDNISGSGGDCFDIRKSINLGTLKFVNNTIFDGMRTFFRIDANANIKITDFVFDNNTVKSISTMNDSNNRGIFAIRVATNMSLKKNLFLWMDGGKETGDYCQLFQNNGNTVVPTLTASGNYAYAQGNDFFAKVDAATAGFTVLDADPCFNSKGNFFQLSNQDLISKKVGASKWWIPYEEQEEDLTQNVLEGAHVWNFADATLFAGDVKNSRVRDELLLVGTEAVPMNADGAIKFLSEAEKTKKGVPTAGYVSFKVNTPGSVDLEVVDGNGSGVTVALYDDSGFAVKGGAAVAAGAGVQKILIPAVEGEGTVYVYPTAAVTLKQLAWSLDAAGGNKVLAAPQPVAEPVTLTEGDEADVVFTWEAVPNAAAYMVSFNKKSPVKQTELSVTVPGATIAALSAGLYNFTVTAVPAEDDIYYTESQAGKASIAIQPKGGSGPVTETLTWDFSDADWQAKLAEWHSTANDNFTMDPAATFNGLTFYSKTSSKWYKVAIDNVDYYYIQFGGKGVNSDTGNLDRYFKFTAPYAGTLKALVSNGSGTADMSRKVYVKVGDGDAQEVAGGFASTAPDYVEFSVDAGDVYISTTGNGLRFLKIEFTYTYTPEEEEPIEYDWNFSDADWQAKLAEWHSTSNDNFTMDPAATFNGLTFYSKTSSKWYKVTIDSVDYYYIQFGGKGLNSDTGNLDRYFKFTAPKAGTLRMLVSNGSGTADMTRKVYVKVGEGTPQEVEGGFASTAPDYVEFSIDAGDVYISTTGNGLRFLRIHFSE